MSLPKEQTIALVNTAKAGDRDAYGALAEAYRGLVFMSAQRKLRNAADAEEVCQDALMAGYQKLTHLRDPAAFPTWLMQIASRTAMNRGKYIATRSTCQLDKDGLMPDREEGDYLVAEERREAVHRELDRLPAIYREVIVDFYFDGMSVLQMRDKYKIPLGTVKRRLFAARKKLAAKLRHLEGDVA